MAARFASVHHLPLTVPASCGTPVNEADMSPSPLRASILLLILSLASTSLPSTQVKASPTNMGQNLEVPPAGSEKQDFKLGVVERHVPAEPGTIASHVPSIETPMAKIAQVAEHHATATADGLAAGPTLAPESADVEELEERWVNFCDGCKPSTGVTSFLGATKSLTDDCREYPHARKTRVKTVTKKKVWTDNCLTTITKPAKKDMYILWVRPEGFAGHDD